VMCLSCYSGYVNQALASLATKNRSGVPFLLFRLCQPSSGELGYEESK
jgi:hypothetical protein